MFQNYYIYDAVTTILEVNRENYLKYHKNF